MSTIFDILGGTDHSIDPGPVCTVTRTRIFDETVLGRKSNSPLVNYQFSFESLDESGNALCLGKLQLLKIRLNKSFLIFVIAVLSYQVCTITR